jgi:hypothetical protein
MAFTEDQLLLSADRAAQLTKALATETVADPLQVLCDEAAADVARMTAGYVLDDLSLGNFTRSLALYRAYSKAGPVPMDVQTDYDAATKELEAIASGKRPNLPRAEAGTNPPSGQWGGATKVIGRMGA